MRDRFSLDNGALWYSVVRHDGKPVFQFETRHDAVGRRVLLHECNDYDIVPVVPLPLDESPPVYRPSKDDDGYLRKHAFSRRGCRA